jgi:hypothetical protein
MWRSRCLPSTSTRPQPSWFRAWVKVPTGDKEEHVLEVVALYRVALGFCFACLRGVLPTQSRPHTPLPATQSHALQEVPAFGSTCTSLTNQTGLDMQLGGGSVDSAKKDRRTVQPIHAVPGPCAHKKDAPLDMPSLVLASHTTHSQSNSSSSNSSQASSVFSQVDGVFPRRSVTVILLPLHLTLHPPIHGTVNQSTMRHGTLSSVATAALLLAAATPSVQASSSQLQQQQQDPQEWKGNAHVRALLR